MQEPGVEQQLHDLRNAACAMQVGRDIFTRRLQVAQHGDALADAFEVVNGPRHFGGMREGEDMQHGVGGTAGCAGPHRRAPAPTRRPRPPFHRLH
ncbi:hypothetical protein G6F23_015670 [Rhizopus arrhizus]|nr:hypothetical protein G6F23_015670 [Rhizopus arrhizus]